MLCPHIATHITQCLKHVSDPCCEEIVLVSQGSSLIPQPRCCASCLGGVIVGRLELCQGFIYQTRSRLQPELLAFFLLDLHLKPGHHRATASSDVHIRSAPTCKQGAGQ